MSSPAKRQKTDGPGLRNGEEAEDADAGGAQDSGQGSALSLLADASVSGGRSSPEEESEPEGGGGLDALVAATATSEAGSGRDEAGGAAEAGGGGAKGRRRQGESRRPSASALCRTATGSCPGPLSGPCGFCVGHKYRRWRPVGSASRVKSQKSPKNEKRHRPQADL